MPANVHYTLAPYCGRCISRDTSRRGSWCGCGSVFYCCSECLTRHSPVHRPMCRPFSPKEVWGIKIIQNWNDPPRIGHPADYFRHELCRVDPGRSTTHPIFERGELCPLTQRIGIPLRVYRTSLMRESSTAGPNEIAVKLRVDPSNGLAPARWRLTDHPGECIVIREDRKPLTRELLETIYSFVVHFMDYPIDDVEQESWARWDGLLNPSVWHFFARKYYQKQSEESGRNAFHYFSPLLCT
ncbi:putative zf-MYND domain-containing protein [Lentinula edodes]|nr:putative zf-MYND domain-containing protein [Lentinula edodes]